MQPRVLLVEDSPPMAQAILKLIIASCDVLECIGDGLHVMEAALRLRPDAILLDISLPGTSGLALLPRLRSLLPCAMLIMLSNHRDPRYVETAFRLGADGYVFKQDADKALLPILRQGRSWGRMEAGSLPEGYWPLEFILPAN